MDWLIGIAIAFSGSICGAFGDNMIKKAYIEIGIYFKASLLLKSHLFFIGLILTTFINGLATIAALGFAPSAVVAPFAAIQICLTLVIARIWLKEIMNKWDYFGCFFIVIGVLLIVIFAGKSSELNSLQVYAEYLVEPASILFFIICGTLVTTFIFLSTDKFSSFFYKYSYEIKRFAIVSSAGLLGGLTNLASKACTVVFSNLLNYENPSYAEWESYLVAAITIIIALGQLFFLNLGLKNYSAIFVIPVTNSFLVATGTMGGLIYLKEIPENNAILSILIVILGLIILIGGILIISAMHSSKQLDPNQAPNRIICQSPSYKKKASSEDTPVPINLSCTN